MVAAGCLLVVRVSAFGCCGVWFVGCVVGLLLTPFLSLLFVLRLLAFGLGVLCLLTVWLLFYAWVGLNGVAWLGGLAGVV